MAPFPGRSTKRSRTPRVFIMPAILASAGCCQRVSQDASLAGCWYGMGAVRPVLVRHCRRATVSLTPPLSAVQQGVGYLDERLEKRGQLPVKLHAYFRDLRDLKAGDQEVQVRGLIARRRSGLLDHLSVVRPWDRGALPCVYCLVHCLDADGRGRHRTASMAGTRRAIGEAALDAARRTGTSFRATG